MWGERRDGSTAEQKMNSARAVVTNYLSSGRGASPGRVDKRLPGAIAVFTRRAELAVREDLEEGKTPVQILEEAAQRRNIGQTGRRI